jgi:hypothetical protein
MEKDGWLHQVLCKDISLVFDFLYLIFFFYSVWLVEGHRQNDTIDITQDHVDPAADPVTETNEAQQADAAGSISAQQEEHQEHDN